MKPSLSTTARLPRAAGARGFTLVELCVGVGLSAALLTQAVPGLQQMREQQRLRAESEELASDLRFARSEAARLHADVVLRISGKGSQACYVLHTGANGDCDCSGGQPVCRAPGAEIIKSHALPTGAGLTLSANVETMRYQYRQGLVTPAGSLNLSLRDGTTIRQVVAVSGRARSCYAGAAMSGLPKCR